MTMLAWIRTLAVAVATLCCTVAAAQEWPRARPITLIVPWSTGGGAEPVARLLAAELGPRLGQNFVVEFKPGAVGVIGTAVMMNSRPDGYTLLLTSPAPLVNSKFLVPDLSYRPEDVTTIAQLTDAPITVFANSKFPVKDLKELVEYARKNPGKVTMGIPGTGGQGHLAAALIETRAKVKFTMVPYKGTGGIQADLRAGVIDVAVGFASGFLSGQQTGHLKGLGVLGDARLADVPDVPSSAELGLPELKQSVWFMLFGPKGMPRNIVTRLNAEINAILALDKVRTALQAQGYTVTQGSTPEGSHKLLEADIQAFKEIHEAGAMKLN